MTTRRRLVPILLQARLLASRLGLSEAGAANQVATDDVTVVR